MTENVMSSVVSSMRCAFLGPEKDRARYSEHVRGTRDPRGGTPEEERNVLDRWMAPRALPDFERDEVARDGDGAL
jgi:hypothetical protein